jgi:hypothetical protein
MDSDQLGNWQITGGSGVGKFAIEPNTGRITVARHHLAPHRNYTLSVIVDDRKLTSEPEVVTIEIR